MVLETVDTIFLVTIKYVKTPRHLTSEANKHTYGGRKSILREFNITQVIGIEEKRLNYVNSVFEGNLKTFHSRNEFRGYQEKKWRIH